MTKTGLSEKIDNIIEDWVKDADLIFLQGRGQYYLRQSILELIAEEQAQPKEADAELLKEVIEMACIECDGAEADGGSDGNESPCYHCSKKEKFKQVLSKYKKRERLAELAKRKGFWIDSIVPTIGNGWGFLLAWGSDTYKVGCHKVSLTIGKNEAFCGETYSEAESKARAYLSKLPDSKGDK